MKREPREERWSALRLRVRRDWGDLLAAELGTLGIGVESQTDPSDVQYEQLTAFLRRPEQELEMRAWVDRRVSDLGGDPSTLQMRVEVVDDGHWVERFQAGLEPFELGRRYLVFPRGRVESDPGDRQPLLLIPGRAFGTGEHATTQLCVEQLERRVQTGDRWLDLGCGTGILLLVAAAQGAGELLGIEIDPEATEVAHEVLESNRTMVGANASFELLCGGLESIPREGWDGAICNISATFTRMHLDRLATLPRVGGLLMISGILTEDVDEVASRLQGSGLVEIDRRVREPWAVLVAERR